MEKSLKIQKEKVILKLEDYFKQKASGYHIEMVFLYGSWARGYPRHDSDIDLAVLFSPQIISEESLLVKERKNLCKLIVLFIIKSSLSPFNL